MLSLLTLLHAVVLLLTISCPLSSAKYISVNHRSQVDCHICLNEEECPFDSNRALNLTAENRYPYGSVFTAPKENPMLTVSFITSDELRGPPPHMEITYKFNADATIAIYYINKMAFIDGHPAPLNGVKFYQVKGNEDCQAQLPKEFGPNGVYRVAYDGRLTDVQD